MLASQADASVRKTLSQYFRHVMTLPEYLARILPSWSEQRIDEIFHPSHATSTALQRELHTLSVGLSACNIDELPTYAASPCAEPPRLQHDVMADVVRRAQARIIRHEGKFCNNMLTLGYRRADDRVETLSMLGSQVVSNHYVNASVTRIVMERQWHVLLAHVGEQVFEHLLVSTALFLPLGSAEGVLSTNVTQVLGMSVSESAASLRGTLAEQPVPRAPQVAGRKRKRRSKATKQREATDNRPPGMAPVTSKLAFVKRTPAEIDLLHSRIFYGKPSRTRRQATIYGLPPSDILNRSSAASTPQARARKVSHYIWPREYGLKNVFSVPEQREETEFEMRRSMRMRENVIDALPAMSMPDRLLPVQRLVAAMARRNDKLDYRRALGLCCPSALPKHELTEKERTEIAADLSELVPPRSTAAAQASTQHVEDAADAMDVDAVEQASAGEQHGPSTAPTYSSKSQFTKYRAPQGCVARFVRLVVRHIVPPELFGSAHNTGVIMRAIDRFVMLRRFESMTLHEVLHGFRLLDCAWLLPRSKRALWQRPTRDEMAKRQRLLHEFLFWLFDNVVVSLLRNNFYATESAKFRNRVLYFRHDDWTTITQPILDSLKEACFERIAKHKAVGIMSQRSFGYSFVRLLPKEVGMRPIVNLRRHSTKVDRNAEAPKTDGKVKKSAKDNWGAEVRQKKSINNTLRQTFRVLNYEKNAHPDDLGSSVFGPDDMFVRLSHFKRRLLRSDGTLPALYFVKMDVAGAFDCIDQERLLKIVDDILRHERYVFQHFVKLMTSHSGRQYKQWPRVVCPEDEQGTFGELMEHLAKTQAWRNTIVADNVAYTHGERTELRDLLREHVGNNLIKVGKDFCRQTIGIPQGSTLSTLMCCYYLARMEKELMLTPAAHDEQSMLMRWTDDFLFISTDEAAARRFFVSVQSGSAEFNCVLAPAKSMSNFDLTTPGMSEEMASVAGAVCVTPTTSMPWCSFRIDTRTLAVRYDMERYRWSSMADSLTIPMRNAFALGMQRAYTFNVQQRASPIYLDVALNTLDGVLVNVYQAFVVSTMRLLTTFVATKKRHDCAHTEEREAALLLRCIDNGIETCYAGASARVQRQQEKAIVAQRGQVDEGEVEPWPVAAQTYRWLALHATHTALSVWPRTHPDTLRDGVQRLLRRTQRRSYAQLPMLREVARGAWQDVRSVVHSVTIT